MGAPRSLKVKNATGPDDINLLAEDHNMNANRARPVKKYAKCRADFHEAATDRNIAKSRPEVQEKRNPAQQSLLLESLGISHSNERLDTFATRHQQLKCRTERVDEG